MALLRETDPIVGTVVQTKFYLPSERISKVGFRRPARGKLQLIVLCCDGKSWVSFNRPYDFSAIIVNGWPIWRQSLRIPVDIEVPFVFGATDNVSEVEQQAMHLCREAYKYLFRVYRVVEGTFHVVLMPSAGNAGKGTCTIFSILYASRPVEPLFQHTIVNGVTPNFLEYVTRPVRDRPTRFERPPVI